MKRLFDIVVSTIILLVFFPLAVIISLLIILDGQGGVFYTQERIGRYGKPFQLLKFRTMKKNADKMGKLTVGMRDPRITRVGYFLRKFKLDEFPQFINVLIGSMSIVGPRPEVKEYVILYSDQQREVLKVKPGITDNASLEFFNENEILANSDNPEQTYINDVLPKKIELNRTYIENPSIGADIRIMWKTFLKILS